MREQDEILVVDDELIVLKLLTDILSAEGFQVQSADTGEMALASIASKPPHLILLDIKMPGMDGFEVCRRLKAQEETRDITIIFLSAITDLDQKMKGFELGAVDFITKPFQREELLARVRTHLELSRLRIKLEAQVAERTTQLRMLAEEVEDLYDNAPCGYHSLDEDGIFLRINSTELDWLGYTRNELIGKKKFSDLIAPKNLPIFRENLISFKIQGFLRDLELEIIRQDGTTFPALLNASGIPDSQGNYLMIRSILSDITQRKQLDEVLRESEEKYRTLFEHTGTALIILEEDTTVSLANNEFATLTGYTKAEIEGNKKSMDFTVPEDKDKVLGYHRLRRKDPAAVPREYESRFVDKNGRIILTHNTVAMIPGTAKSIVSFVDITERKRAEEELQKSEELYRSLFENMLNGFAYCRILFEDGKPQDFIYLAVNKAFESQTGLKEVIGKKVTEVIPGIRETDPQLFEIYGRVAMTGQPERFEMFVEALQMWFSISVYSPAPEHFVAVFDVITERKRAEEALRESEERYRQLFDSSIDAVLLTAPDGSILTANPAACDIFGYTEDEIRNLRRVDIVDTSDSKLTVALEERSKTGKFMGELTFIRKDGTRFPGELSSAIFRDKDDRSKTSIIIRDITERKQAEKEIQNLARFPSENPNPILRINRDGTLLYINRAGLSLLPEWHLQVGQSVPPVLKDAISGVMNSGSTLLIDLEHGKQIYSFDGTPIANAGYINFYGRDITEHKRAEEQLQHTLDSLRKAVGTTIQVMVSAVETRDAYTAGHQLRSADLARAIAAEMGLTKDQIDGIRMAGSIHDIGKLSIPTEILSKPTKLTEIEFALIKQHPLKGYEILKNVDSPWPLAQIVYQHHERMDGSGYPRSLKGNDILMEARILAVSDVVEAIASHRPYRPALGIEKALEEISQNRGILYDSEVVDACLRLFKEKGLQLEQKCTSL